MDAVPHADPWVSPAWQGEVEGWIDGELARLGLERTGPIVHEHVRHWSTVARVPVALGDVFFKASAAPFEAGLTDRLATWRPDCMLIPLVVDHDQGRILMPDGGPRLREILNDPNDLWHWDRILALFAGVQSDLSDRMEELIEIGVPDRRLRVLPRLYDALLDDSSATRLGQPDGVSIEELSALRDLIPRISDFCDRLADLDVPESLHNGDFHDGNVFFGGDRYTLFDWGDACIAHPFFSAVAAMRNVEDRFSLTWGGSTLTRLRYAYLGVWTNRLAMPELVRAFEIATPLTLICGALGWQPYVSRYPGEFPAHVSTWLQELLEVMRGIG